MSENDPDRIVVRREDLPPEIAASGGSAPGAGQGVNRADPLSKLALALGILSILILGVAIGPIAMIVGCISAMRTRGDGSRSQKFAIGGIVTGTVGMLLWIGILFWMIPRGEKHADAPTTDILSARADPEAVARAVEPIRTALRANVKIVVERRAGIGWLPAQNGSGTLFSQENGRSWLLTCRHVVETSGSADDARVLVYWIDGKKSDARIEWKGENDVDLAVVSVPAPAAGETPPAAPVSLGIPEMAQVGEAVFAIGNPLDYDGSLVTGVISAVRTIGATSAPVHIFQAQIPLNPGNSGGGLYTQEGKLIGVNSWTLPKGAVEGIGFAISIENLSGAIAKGPAPMADALRHAMPPPPPPAAVKN